MRTTWKPPGNKTKLTFLLSLTLLFLFKEVPSKVRKTLNLPSSDQGIDLIAETKDSKYWAI